MDESSIHTMCCKHISAKIKFDVICQGSITDAGLHIYFFSVFISVNSIYNEEI